MISNNAYDLARDKFNVPKQEFGNEGHWGEISFRDLGERRLKVPTVELSKG